MCLIQEKNELQLHAWQKHQTVIVYDEESHGAPRLIPGQPAILVAASVQEAQTAVEQLRPEAWIYDP